MSDFHYDILVTSNKSGNFTTILKAIQVAYSPQKFIIKIKGRIYQENLNVHFNKTDLVFVGVGRGLERVECLV